MATTDASRVLFCYVPHGKTKPTTVNDNTIYFLEDAQEIHVGSKVIAANVTAAIPSFVISGTGDCIVDASYDDSTKTLTLTKGSYTIVKAGTPDTGYSATYQLFLGDTAKGDKINIPKDMVIESGSVVDITFDNGHLYDGATDVTEIIKGTGGTATAADAGKYIKLVVANADEDLIYIKATDLVDVYTAGDHITITNNVIAHASQGADASTALPSDDASHLYVSGQVAYDAKGHVISVAAKDIHDAVATIAAGEAASAIGDLDAAEVGGSGKYIAAVSETDGVISATEGTIDSTVTEDSSNLVTSGAVYDAIDAVQTDVDNIETAIEAMDLSEVGGSGKYLTTISQADGVVSATAATADTTVTQNSSNLVTSGAVYTAVDDAISKWTVVS